MVKVETTDKYLEAIIAVNQGEQAVSMRGFAPEIVKLQTEVLKEYFQVDMPGIPPKQTYAILRDHKSDLQGELKKFENKYRLNKEAIIRGTAIDEFIPSNASFDDLVAVYAISRTKADAEQLNITYEPHDLTQARLYRTVADASGRMLIGRIQRDNDWETLQSKLGDANLATYLINLLRKKRPVQAQLL